MAKGQKEARVLFTADVSQFTKGITQINKSLGNLKSDLKACNADIKANGASFDNLSDKQKTLKQVISQLNDKLENQEKCLKSAKDILGEGSEQYNRYYRAINNTKSELSKFEKELKDTERALEDVNNKAGDLDSGLSNATGGMELTGSKSVALGTMLGNLASGAISMCVEKLSEFGQYLWELPEATEEFRNSMARLQATTQDNGKSFQGIKESYHELMGYFNDSDAVSNILDSFTQLDVSEKTLKDSTEAIKGAFVEFKDEIDMESLAEDIEHTVKMSEVQGQLADVIEKTGGNLEQFNTELANCKTEEEKLQVINDYMNEQFGESKAKYEELYGAQLNYNEQLSKTNETQAQIADSVLLVKTKMEELKGQLLSALAPAIETICNSFLQFVEWVKKCQASFEQFKQSPVWQWFTTVAEVFIQPIIAKLKVFGEVCKTVWSVCELLWAGLSSLANMFATVLQKCQPVQDALKWLGDRFKTANSSANPLISTLQNMQQKLQKAKEWINKVSEKWSFSNPTLPSGLQKMINKCNEVWSAIQRIAKTFTLKFNFKIPKLTTKSLTVMGQTFKYPAISWNAKGGIFTKPTIFNTRAGLQGVGEMGHEAILPLDSFYNHLDNTIASSSIDYGQLKGVIQEAVHEELKITLNINGRKVAETIAGDLNRVNGSRQKLVERGVKI